MYFKQYGINPLVETAADPQSTFAVDVDTGERIWHYQMVRHGLWDYDPPAAPNVMDVVIDGEPRKVVAQVTKQAFVFAFDRETGEPIWPIEDRPVAVEGQVVIRPMMYLALSYDHRIVDGKESVSFLVRVKEFIESPEKMLYGEDPVKVLLEL